MEHFRSLFKHVPASGHCSFLHMVGLYCGHATQAGMDWEPEVSGLRLLRVRLGVKSSGAPVHESLDEMKQKYEGRRDKEFAAHVCLKHARATRPKTE